MTYDWLASKGSGDEKIGKGALSSTQRSYRKEAERLLLWSILVRSKALSSLAVEDATAYRSFLADRRPLEGPLTPAALRQSLIILRSLFAFLMSQGYVVGNPLAAVSLPSQPQRPLGSNRTLAFALGPHQCLAAGPRCHRGGPTAASRHALALRDRASHRRNHERPMR